MLLNIDKVKRKVMIGKSLLLLVFLFLVDFSNAAEEIAPPIPYSSSLFQMMLGLAATIVMIFVVVWLIKRVGYTGYSATNKMKIKSTLPLSPKEKLLLIDVEGETMLIGVAPGFVGLLKTLEPDQKKQVMTANRTICSGEKENPKGSSDSSISSTSRADEAMSNTSFSSNKFVNGLSSSFAEKLKSVINKSDAVR
jgi:flagellar biogenesis protein FliO